jgi:hypothetical protein
MREGAGQIMVAKHIMVRFLSWVAERPRSRGETLEGWHSCPHISVLEDAIVDGLVGFESGGRRTLRLTSRGQALLEAALLHAANSESPA